MANESEVNPAIESEPRRSHSLFGPVVLIAAGAFFLLSNLGVLPAVEWWAAARFWPLLLIFLGLDVIVVRVRPPEGTLLSLLVAVTALATFSFLLLNGPAALQSRLGLALPTGQLKAETFAVNGADVTSADITLRLGRINTEIGALDDPRDLVAGTLWTTGTVAVQRQSDDTGHIEVEVGETGGDPWFLNPQTVGEPIEPWTIGLSPAVPMALQLDGGDGSLTAALDALTLTALAIDAGNGSTAITLPGGNYDISVDGGNGSLTLTLPEAGRQAMEIDGGNGRIVLRLPAGMAARLEYEKGAGSIVVDERWQRLEIGADEGIYQTAGYDTAADRILIHLDGGAGVFAIELP